MFSLSLIEHTLRLPPHLLSLSLEKAVRHELEGLFLDKVIPDLGLCVSVCDIIRISGGFISPGDGAPTYTVRCKLITFRPFLGETIDAKLKDYDENGLHLSLGFFDDIYVPSHFLPSPSTFEPDPENGNKRRWVWEYEGNPFPIDEIGAMVRFQVKAVTQPKIPLEQPNNSKPFAPMVITGTLVDDAGGLGPVSWWD